MADTGGFDPRAILETLERHGVRYILIGGVAATIHGSPHVTFDLDITPDPAEENLTALARALEELEARIRAEGVPEGLPFDVSRQMLERTEILNLVTRHGALDLSFVPSGTQGYGDLKRAAREVDLDGVTVAVAALADVIRSKEAAGRERDRLVLPTLRRLQARLEEEDR